MSPLDSRNIVDPTQCLGYVPDQKVQTNKILLCLVSSLLLVVAKL